MISKKKVIGNLKEKKLKNFRVEKKKKKKKGHQLFWRIKVTKLSNFRLIFLPDFFLVPPHGKGLPPQLPPHCGRASYATVSIPYALLVLFSLSSSVYVCMYLSFIHLSTPLQRLTTMSFHLFLSSARLFTLP